MQRSSILSEEIPFKYSTVPKKLHLLGGFMLANGLFAIDASASFTGTVTGWKTGKVLNKIFLVHEFHAYIVFPKTEVHNLPENGTELQPPGQRCLCIHQLHTVKLCCISIIHRFVELFEVGDYENAAFHAAMSPHGILRNINIMEKFKGTYVPSCSPATTWNCSLVIIALFPKRSQCMRELFLLCCSSSSS